ncbi:MAG: 50S ribosomal protein L18Ae [Pyrobaculum sp.]
MPKIYRVAGETTTGMRFRLEITAEKPHDAIEKAYSLLGSRHKLRRIEIKIREVAPLESPAREEVKTLLAVDKVVKYD